jgi:hypothetical protein
MVNPSLYVDRIEASKILKTSTRTVDRYMRKYNFKTRKDGRLVLIKRVDIDKIIKEHLGRIVDINDESFSQILSSNSETPATENKDTMSTLAVSDIKVEKIKESLPTGQAGESNKSENRIYKDLYQETKQELKDKQDRLEAATYRVGQLESQVKSMVPLLDYTKKDKELQETFHTMEQKAVQNQELVAQMERKLRSERIAKWTYLSLVGLLLVAEPILFVLWAFN